MTLTFATLLALLNIVSVVLLSVNAWVHRVTGPASLEARVAALEKLELPTSLAALREKQARQEEHFEATDQRVGHLERRVDQWARV
jgi:hypothetical protein